MLKADQGLKATISVHTTIADKDTSLSLKTYLVSQGVKESQVEATGYGGETTHWNRYPKSKNRGETALLNIRANEKESAPINRGAFISMILIY